MRGVDLDLLAQPADQIVDRAVEDVGFAPADEVEQTIAAHHLPRMPHQRMEQMIFARRQRDLRARFVDEHALDPGGASYAFGPWVLRDVERVLVDAEGQEVALSSGEYHLLQALVRHPRQVMSRDRLLDLVRGREADIFDRAIDNLVSRLRKKIEVDPAHPQLVKTVWGGGYTLACEVKRLGGAA